MLNPRGIAKAFSFTTSFKQEVTEIKNMLKSTPSAK